MADFRERMQVHVQEGFDCYQNMLKELLFIIGLPCRGIHRIVTELPLAIQYNNLRLFLCRFLAMILSELLPACMAFILSVSHGIVIISFIGTECILFILLIGNDTQQLDGVLCAAAVYLYADADAPSDFEDFGD